MFLIMQLLSLYSCPIQEKCKANSGHQIREENMFQDWFLKRGELFLDCDLLV